MWIIAYEIKSAMNNTIRKAVLCRTFSEYERVRERIMQEDAKGNVKAVLFDEFMDSSAVK